MGIPFSNDDDGRPSYADTADDVVTINRLENTVRDLVGLLRECEWTDTRLDAVLRRPEVVIALRGDRRMWVRSDEAYAEDMRRRGRL